MRLYPDRSPYECFAFVSPTFGACMYFQEPSLAQFQLRMKEELHKNNLRTLFGVENIPQNSQLRDILDAIPSEEFAPIFKDFFERLRWHKHLEDYAIFPNTLLCVIDGTQYHSSKDVHCEQCLHKEHKNGEITYSHGVLQGAIILNKSVEPTANVHSLVDSGVLH